MRRSRPIPKAAQTEAVAEGIDPEDLHGLAKTIRSEDAAGVDAQNAVLKEVRSMLPGKGKLMGTENYQEWQDVPGLEEAAQYFRDRGRADLGDPNRLFELLQNGNRKPMTEREVYDQALKTLRERPRPTEPPPPDTDFNFGANELATMAGGKQIEGETVPNPMYRSENHTALADRFGRDLSSADLPDAQKQQYARNFLEVLGRMTPEAARRANAAVKKATFFTDTTALGSQLSKISRKVADAIARGSEIGGAVDYERGDIYLDGRTELSDAPEVYAHELGHSVDGAGGSTKQALSNQSDWIFAWEKEIQGGNLGDYAATSPREGFAEFYRMAAGMGIDPAQIRERFPQAAKFFDSLGLLGEGKKAFTKPDQIFAQAINDGPVHGDVLKQELAPYQEPERIGKDEDELRRTPVLDAAVKFLADDSGALNLNQLGSRASDAYESIKRGVRGLSDHLNKLAGAKFPKISRISEEAGNAMARMDTAREMGRLASADYIDRILGKDVTEEQARRIGSAFHQERFDEAKENFRNASAAYSQAADNARQAGDSAGAAKWAAKATEYLRKATHVRDFIGTKDSALKTMAEYQQVRNSPEYQEAMKRYQTELTPSLEQWFKQAEGMQETDPINSLTQLDGRPFTAKVLEEGPQKPDYVGQAARGNLANRKLNKLGAAREAELASPNYETDMREIISHTIQSRVYLAKKAEAFRAAEREGVITWAKPGERVGNAERIDGVNPPKGTQAAQQGETDLWVTKDENAHEEFRQALRIDKAATLPIIKQAADASTVGALVSTMEATFHTLNNLTAMFKAGVNPVDIVTGFIKVAKGDSDTMRRLVDLASIGVSKEGHEASMTYSPMNPLSWTGRFLETLDRSMRLALDKGFDRLSDGYFGMKALGDRVKPTEANRRDFINQLGNYSKGSQSRLVVLLRDLGIGPFATAGTNYIMQGVRAATLNPGVEAANWKQAVALRAEQLARVTSVIGSVAIANYLRWGRWDGDDNTPLGHLKLGEGKDSKTSTMNLAAFTGVPRGLRSLGLMSVVEGVRQDKSAGQITDDALKSIGMSAAHPAFGPLPAFIYTAFTGKDLVGRQLAEKVSTAKTPLGMARAEAEGRPPAGSSQMWQNFKTAIWHAIPALGTALGKTGRVGEEKEPAERALEYLGPFAPQDRGRPEKRKRIGAR